MDLEGGEGSRKGGEVEAVCGYRASAASDPEEVERGRVGLSKRETWTYSENDVLKVKCLKKEGPPST